MNRSRITSGAIALLTVCLIAGTVAASDSYKEYPIANLLLDGRSVASAVPPIIMDGTTLVPLRTIAETLGLKVGWDQTTKTVRLETVPDERIRTLVDENAVLEARVASLEQELAKRPTTSQSPASDVKQPVRGLLEIKQVLVEMNGNRYRLTYYPTQHQVEGDKVYPNAFVVALVISVATGDNRPDGKPLPGGVAGSIVYDKTYVQYITKEQKYLDMENINSAWYQLFTVTNPASGKSLEISTRGTTNESRDTHELEAIAQDDWSRIFDKLGIDASYSLDKAQSVITIKLNH